MSVARKQKQSARHRQSMRFYVADDSRIVTLISGRKEECDARVIDFSRGGIRVAFSDGPELAIDQDVLVADDSTVSVCTVKNILQDEDGRTCVGLENCHTFPIARLPEKKKAQWGYKETLSPYPFAATCPIALLALLAVTGLAFVLNLGGARNSVVDWAGLSQWRVGARPVSADSSSAGTTHRSRTRPQSEPRRSGQFNPTDARGGSSSPSRSSSTFSMDDGLPKYSGSF